jgi:hypothetical protein
MEFPIDRKLLKVTVRDGKTLSAGSFARCGHEGARLEERFR